jgi:hypothetical protein
MSSPGSTCEAGEVPVLLRDRYDALPIASYTYSALASLRRYSRVSG